MEFLVGVGIEHIGGTGILSVFHFLVSPSLELVESLFFCLEQPCVDESVGIGFGGGNGDVCDDEQCLWLCVHFVVF